jgi:N-methylhydantoinase A
VLRDTGLPLEMATVRRLADGRFVGQGFDLVVTLPDGPYDEGARDGLREAFVHAYREKFALTPPNVPVEFINVRVAVRAPVAGAAMDAVTSPGRDGRADTRQDAPIIKGRRPAYFPESKGWVETTVYDRGRLNAGFELDGPAVVEEEGSTLVIGPSARARVAASGNIVMTIAAMRETSP